VTAGQHVRFLKNARHGEWKKGDIAIIEKVLAFKPQAHEDIYTVRFPDGKQTWCVRSDVDLWDQLQLFSTDTFATE
jgi:hypothetical protein